MRGWVSALVLACACAPDASPNSAAIQLRRGDVTIRERPPASPEGADPLPRLEVVVSTPDGRRLVRDAIAATPFSEGVAWVDGDRRLHLLSLDGHERTIAEAVGGRPIPDPKGERLAFAELREQEPGALLRLVEARQQVRTIAALPGAMAPLAWTERGIVLVGAGPGGVAGVWLLGPGAPAPRCLTNCALRVGESWGSSYLPPPADGESIRVDGELLRYRAADGSEHAVALGGAS